MMKHLSLSWNGMFQTFWSANIIYCPVYSIYLYTHAHLLYVSQEVDIGLYTYCVLSWGRAVLPASYWMNILYFNKITLKGWCHCINDSRCLSAQPQLGQEERGTDAIHSGSFFCWCSSLLLLTGHMPTTIYYTVHLIHRLSTSTSSNPTSNNPSYPFKICTAQRRLN